MTRKNLKIACANSVYQVLLRFLHMSGTRLAEYKTNLQLRIHVPRYTPVERFNLYRTHKYTE